MMICSFIPGRVRVRDNSLKNTSAAENIIKKCARLPGFLSAEHNPVTGGLLLAYDDAKLPGVRTPYELSSYVKKNIPEISSCFAAPSSGGGKAFNRLMAASLAVCLLSPYAKMMKLHMYGGIFFAALSVKHMYDYKNRII